MNIISLALEGALQVLIFGLILGAGLPAIFALGIRALSFGTHDEDEAANDHKPHPVAKVIAGFCFAVVILGIVAGVGTIVAHGLGVSIGFDGILPTFTAR